MAFQEDLSVFFDTEDFAVAASWVPSNGSAAQSANVILNAPDESLFGDAQLSSEYSVAYDASKFTELASGENITVDGVSYRVREVRKIQDGKVTRALLSKY